MMTQIRIISKSLFSASEVQSLAEKIRTAVTPLVATQPVIATLNDNLFNALEKLKAARKNGQLNTQTEQVMEADEVRDMAFRAFVTYVKAASFRQNEVYSIPAEALQKHLEKIDLQLPYMGYSKQTAELNLFFAEMDKVTAHIEVINASPWLKELKNAQDEFLVSYEGKIDEETEKSILIPTKEAKEATLQQLMALTHTLNGLAMAGTEGIAEVNRKVDQLIESVEQPARARYTRKQNASKDSQTNNLQF